MSPTFSSLSIYNYRVWASGALVSNVGTWMGRVAQDWLVLTQLTNHDATALGVVTGLQFSPVVLLAPYAGTLADRFPKRRLLFLTQAGLAITSAILAALTILGVVQLWHVYALALLQGAVTALDNPTRQAFVSELVPPEKLSNAVGLNSASFNAARLIGPGVAGLLIGLIGTGWTLVVNTFSFIAVLGSLLVMHVRDLRTSPRRSGRGGVREGLAYVRHRPDILLILAIVFMLGTFGMNFQITIALMATKVFGRGAAEYGLLSSIMAIGSLAAALLAARRARPRLRIIVAALAGFTVFTTFAALSTSYWMFAICLIPCGLSALTVMTTANSTVQLSVDPIMRGRVMALYMAVFMGGTPLGSPFIGWIGSTFGPRWTILVGSLATGVTVIGAMVYLMRRNEISVSRTDPVHWRVAVEPKPEAITPERVA